MTGDGSTSVVKEGLPTIRELMTTTALLGPDPGGPVVDGRRTRGNELVVWIDVEKRRDLFAGRATNTSIRRHSGCFCRWGECRRIFPDELLHTQWLLPRQFAHVVRRAVEAPRAMQIG